MEIKKPWETEGIDRIEWLLKEAKGFWESPAGKEAVNNAKFSDYRREII